MLDYNTSVVLAGTGLLGVASGVIGSFAVLRRRALLGDALAHAALPGIGLAFLIVGARSFPALLGGALVSALLGAALVGFLTRYTRTREDAAIGIVLSVFFGAGLALMKVIQNASVEGNKAGLQSFIFGQTAGLILGDVYAIAILVIAVLIAVLLLYKEFKVVSFDREFAAVQGWPAQALDYLLLGLLAVTIVVGLQAVGVVLMAAMLILPGSAARFWTERLGLLLALAGLLGFLAGALGTLISYFSAGAQLPAGPTIVLVGTTLFLLSMTLAPRRGVLAMLIRHRRLCRRVRRQHFLRAIYERLEPQPAVGASFDSKALERSGDWSGRSLRAAIREAARAGWIAPAGQRGWWTLSEEGLRMAADVVRSHRLWELFLIEYADIAADHVHRDADMLEHVIPDDLVDELEEHLRRAGRLPEVQTVPVSPHGAGEERDR
jgi:manganese/zinc/iron transport system permease protein